MSPSVGNPSTANSLHGISAHGRIGDSYTADLVLYLASAYAVRRPVGDIPGDAAEAIEYWWDEITRRTNEKLAGGLEPQQVDYGMIEALDAVRRA